MEIGRETHHALHRDITSVSGNRLQFSLRDVSLGLLNVERADNTKLPVVSKLAHFFACYIFPAMQENKVSPFDTWQNQGTEKLHDPPELTKQWQGQLSVLIFSVSSSLRLL